MRYLLIAAATLLLVSCSATKQKQLQSSSYMIGKQAIDFEDPQKNREFDGCLVNAYTISDKDIFLEYLKLDSRCSWNGLGSSFFRNLLNQTFSLSVKKSFKAKEYSIVEYQAGDKRFYFLSRTYRGGNYFIIDYSGEFAKKICLECDVIAKKEQLGKRFEKSLAKNNILNNYFSPKDTDAKPPYIVK